jgi:hypothetical protein
MKSAIGKLIIAMLVAVLLAESCYAQATGGVSGQSTQACEGQSQAK